MILEAIYLIVTTLVLGFITVYFIRDMIESGVRYMGFVDGMIGLAVIALFSIGAYLTVTHILGIHVSFNVSFTH